MVLYFRLSISLSFPCSFMNTCSISNYSQISQNTHTLTLDFHLLIQYKPQPIPQDNPLVVSIVFFNEIKLCFSCSLVWANTMVNTPSIPITMVQNMYMNFIHHTYVCTYSLFIVPMYYFPKFTIIIPLFLNQYSFVYFLCHICTQLYNHPTTIIFTSLSSRWPSRTTLQSYCQQSPPLD